MVFSFNWCSWRTVYSILMLTPSIILYILALFLINSGILDEEDEENKKHCIFNDDSMYMFY